VLTPVTSLVLSSTPICTIDGVGLLITGRQAGGLPLAPEWRCCERTSLPRRTLVGRTGRALAAHSTVNGRVRLSP